MTYSEAVEKGREVARKSRYDGVNNDDLRDILPGLTDDEIRELGERIEQSIKHEVKNAVLRKEWEKFND